MNWDWTATSNATLATSPLVGWFNQSSVTAAIAWLASTIPGTGRLVATVLVAVWSRVFRLELFSVSLALPVYPDLQYPVLHDLYFRHSICTRRLRLAGERHPDA